MPQKTVQEFSASIKAKYPQYKDIDDFELAQKIVSKYPQYKDVVDLNINARPGQVVMQGQNKVTPNPRKGQIDSTSSNVPIVKIKETEEPQKGFWQTWMGDLIEGMGGVAANLVGNTMDLGERLKPQNIIAEAALRHSAGSKGYKAAENLRKQNSTAGDTKWIADQLISKGNQLSQKSNDYYGSVQVPNGNTTTIRPKDFTDLWKEGRYGAAAGNVLLEGAKSLPTSIAAFTPAGLGIIGAGSINDKYNDVSSNTNTNMGTSAVNAVLTGAYEVLSEGIGAGIEKGILKSIAKKQGRKEAEKSVKKLIFDFIKVQPQEMATEGLEEAVNSVASQVTDYATGITNTPVDWQQTLKATMYGVGGGAFGGATLGGGITAIQIPGAVQNQKSTKARETLINEIVQPNIDGKVDIHDNNTLVGTRLALYNSKQAMDEALKDADFTFNRDVVDLDPQDQRSILHDVLTADNLTSVQKNAIVDYVSNAALQKTIQESRQREWNEHVQGQMEQLQNSVNIETGTLVRAKLKGDESGQTIFITGGLRLRDNENFEPEIDIENSNDAVYYRNEDGEVIPTTADAIEFVGESGLEQEKQSLLDYYQNLLQQTDAQVNATLQQALLQEKQQQTTNEVSVYTPGTTTTVNGQTFVVAGQDEAGNYLVNDENGQPLDRFTQEEMQQMGFVAAAKPTKSEQTDNKSEIQVLNDNEVNNVTETLQTPQYPLNKKGEIDFENFTPEHHYQYAVQTEGETVAQQDLKNAIKDQFNQITKHKKKIEKAPFEKKAVLRQQLKPMQQKLEILTALSDKYIPQVEPKILEKRTTAEGTAALTIKERWDNSPKIAGFDDTFTLPNGEVINGRWTLSTAFAPTPSHNPETYQSSVGFPTTPEGKNVNDNDYTNKHAEVETKAADYDSRAIDDPIVVSEGVVVSGNNRTMSGQIAAKNGTDIKYVEALKTKAKKYGFTTEQVESIENPRIYFEVTDQLPLNVDTFAKFNAPTSKTKSATEKAIVATKRNDAELTGKIMSTIEGFDTLAEFYTSEKAQTEVLKYLLESGVINQNEVPELFESNNFTANGRNYLEAIIIGNVMQEDQIKVLNIDGMKQYRAKIVRAIVPLLQNSKLQESIIPELNQAIMYIYESDGNLMDYFSQQNLFAENNFNKDAVLLSIALQRTETNFKKFVADYNNALKDQTIDMFLGRTKTKEDVYEQFRKSLTESERATINNAKRNQQQPANIRGEQINSPDKKSVTGGTTTTGIDSGITEQLTQAELDTQELDAYIAEQAHNTNPTEKQKETGIYDKARISLQGHNITIETLKGTQRSGVDSNGKAWSITMNNHYGELDGTTGYDGDAIDVFVGPNPKGGQIFVIDQLTSEGTFDESKVMLGFDSAEEAKAAYMSNYEAGWKGFGSITPAGENFKQWLYDGKKQRKPFAEYKETPEAVETSEQLTSEKAEKQPWEMTKEQFMDLNDQGIDVTGWYESNDAIRVADYMDEAIYLKNSDKQSDKNKATTLEKLAGAITENWLNTHSHEVLVKQAVTEGKPVPAKVLADYPELKKQDDRLSAFKKDDLVIRSGEVFKIIEAKGSLWKLQNIETGYKSTWNADNNGGFSLYTGTTTQKYKNGDSVYYQGKKYRINGVYNGEQMYDLETEDGKPAFDEIDESELSTQAPEPRSILDAAVEQVKKNEAKSESNKLNAAQAEADAALQDFLDAFNDLNSDNLGIVDNTAEKQAKMLVAGTKMVGAYTKLGVYKFSELVQQIQAKGIQITEELLSAIKKAYGAFSAENEIDELDDMKTVRSFTTNDITNNQTQQQDDTTTNSETPYKATLFEVESIESAAQNATDSKQAGKVIERCKAVKESIDKQIEELQLQLAAYETRDIDHEQPNKVVEKLIEKDVREYSKALAQKLGFEHDTIKKGKQEYANSNIAPAGGTATFILWKPNSEYGVYVSISYEPDYKNGYDDYKATQILWRATSKANKYTGFGNRYAQPGITVGEFSKLIEREVNNYDKNEYLTQKTDNLPKNDVSLNDQKFIKEHIIFGSIPKTNDNDNSKQRVLQGSNKRISRATQPDLFSGAEEGERTGGNVGTQSNALSGPDAAEQQPAGRTGSVLSGNADVLTPALVPFNAEDNDTQSFNQSRKYDDNIAAIETLITLVKENRKATPDEKAILSNYAGFGGLKDIVLNPESTEGWKESNLKYRQQVKRINELADEFDKVTGTSGSLSSIKSSILNAHFTSSTIIRSVYDGVQKLGFKGGRMLEPSAGIGNFVTYAPERIKANSSITAVELDNLTGNILKYLHDDVNVKVSGIQDAQIPNNSQDLVISNVPFGNYKIFDKTFKGEKAEFQNRIHNYFFAKAVDMAREGGIIAFVTSKGVMDAQGNESLRKYLNDNTEFLGAVRLPNNAFKNNANTEVVTDIIFLKKNTTGTKNNPDFVSTKQVEATHKDGEKQNVTVNNYFVENPQNMLGNIVAGGLYSREDYTVENKTGYDLSKAIKNALPAGVYEKVNSKIGMQANDSQQTIDAIKEGNIEVTGGRVVRKEEGQLIDISINEPQNKIEHYIRLRNALMNLIYSEYLGKPDSELNAIREQLNTEYDTFVKKHGKLSKNAIKIAKQDADGFNVLSLEVADKKDGKADIFRQRTIQPIQNKLTADSVDEAIVISLYENAGIDVERIAELLNITVPEVLQQAKGKIFEQPEGGFVTREEYLSGNVKAKLRQAQEAVDKGFSEFAFNVEQLMEVIPADIPAMHIEARLGSRWIPQEVYSEFAQHLFNTPSAKIIYQKSIDAYSNNGRIETVEAQSKWGTARRNGSDILLDALHINPPKIFDTIKEFEQEKRVLNTDETKKAVDKYEEIRTEFENWVYKSEERRTLLARIYNEKYNTTVKRTYNGDHLNIAGINGVTLRRHQKDAIWMLLQNNGGIIDHLVGAGKTFVMVAGTMEMKRTGIAKKPMIIALKSTIPQIVESYRKAYPMAKVLAPLEKDFTKDNRRKLFSQIANNEWDVIIMSHENYGKIPHEADIQRDFLRAEMQEIEDERAELEQQGEKQALKGLEIRLKNLEARLEKISDIDKDNTLTFEQMGIDHIMVDESQQFKNLSYVTKQRGVAGLSKAEGSKRAFNLFIGIRYLQQKYGADKGTTFLSGTPISNSMVEMYLLLKYLRPGKMAELGFNSFDAWATTFASPNSDIEFTVTGDFKSKTRFREFINVPELSMLYTEIADIRTDANTPLDKPKMKGGGYSVVEIKMSDDQIEYGQRLMEFARTKDGSHIGMTLNKNQETAAMLLATNLSSKMAIDMRLIDSSYDYDPNGKIAKLVDNVERIYNETAEHKGTQLIFSDLGTPKNKTNKTAGLRDYMEDEMGVNLDTLNEIFGNPDEAGYKYPSIGAIREKLSGILELTDAEIDNIISESEQSEGAFNVYAEVRKRLVEKGIPEEQVVFIHDYNSQRAKEKLFKQIQNGEIRIVLGSTQKLGTGVNVQDRVVAVHHLDVPWTPASMEQRNGRAIRQGNWVAKNHYGNELPIYAYATERTLDAYKYQLLQTKQRFLDQVKSGDVEERTVRESDGDSESGVGYAELVAMLSGNTDILLKAKLEQQVQKLTKSKRNYLSEVYEAQDKKQKLEERIPVIESNIAKTTENIETITNAVKYDAEGKMEVSDINGEKLVVKNDKGKVVPTERIDYGKRAVEISKAKLDAASFGNIVKLFSQNGFDFYGSKRNEFVTNNGKTVPTEKRYITLRANNGVEYNVSYSETPGVLLNNIQKAIQGIPAILTTQQSILDKANKDIVAYNEIISKGTEWEKEPELTKALNELKEVTKRLDEISTKEQPKPNIEDETTQFQKISPIGFYSTVEKALEAINQERGTRDQFRAMLLKNGAKQAEMDWMGFDELPEKLTKADIQNWIDENRIEVQELVKGKTEWIETKKGNWERKTDRETPTGHKTKSGKVVIKEIDGKFYATPSITKFTQVFNTLDEAKNHYDNIDGLSGDTKFSQYVLPGGENYKELLMTMPSKYTFEQWYNDNKSKYGETRNYNELPKEFKDVYLSEYRNRATNTPSGTAHTISNNEFKSSHFDEPNILAHVRFNERTVNGEKVLFIEEFQSDWAQKGKKEGFAKNMFVVTDFYGNKVMKPKLLGEGYASYETKPEAEKHMELMGNPIGWEIKELPSNNIPDMPFKKTDQWVNLAARGMMRYAAENGFDRIAWTTGEQQADRYDLSKKIEKVEYWKVEREDLNEPRYGIYVYGKQGNRLYSTNKSLATPSELEVIVGKELTQKIIDNATTELNEFSGLDLKVGGEGMKAFYDAIVPSAMSKLGKPFGAKIETIDLSDGHGFRMWEKSTGKYLGEFKGSYINVSENGNRERVIPADYKTPEQVASEMGLNLSDVTVKYDEQREAGLLMQQSIPVTDSMKESAMAGLPLYHTGTTMQPATTTEVADTVEQLLKTRLAKEVRMVTPEEIAGILEGNEQLHANFVVAKIRNQQAESDRQYEKADELWKALNDAGFTDMTISRSITNFGVSTYVQGQYGLKYRISDHSVTNTNRVLDEIHFGFNTPIQPLVELAKLKKERIEARQAFVEEQLKKEKERADAAMEKWQRIKHNFEGFVFKKNNRTYQDFATFSAAGSATRLNVYQKAIGQGYGQKAFSYEWTEPTEYEKFGNATNYGSSVPSIEYIEAWDEGTGEVETTRFMRTPSGTIYGFVKGGVVYLNSSTPNLNTPIHEFGHLWIDAIEGSDLYNRGAELVKDTPYWERVNSDPNYKDLSEAARTKEAMAMAIGDKGETVKRNIGLFARIKVWIADVWTRIGAKFGIQNLTTEQIQNLTFNDFVDVAVSELMSGENLAERNKNTNFETPINNNGSNEQTRLDNRRTMESEPQRLPLGTLTSSIAVGKTIAGTTTTNPRTSRTADAKSQREHWNKSKELKQLAAQAKADGTWIEDITTLTDGKEHFANGTENNVYRSKDGHKVIKVNNLLFLNENDLEFAYTRDLNYFFDRISAHNTLFPEDAYNIVGFTKNETGQVCIVMEQPYISSNVHPTIEEIETDLSKRGFTKTTLGEGINQGLTGYTNGIYELTDVKSLNVLKDENGNMHYIDLDISKTIQRSTPEKPTFKGNLGEYAFQVVQHNEEYAERAERTSKMQRLQQIMIEKRALVTRHKNGEVSNQEYAKQMLALHEEKQRVMKGLPELTPEDDGPDDNDPKPTRTPGQSITEYATATADWNYRKTLAKALAKVSNDITGGLPPVDDDTDIDGDMLRLELDQRLGGWFGRLAEGWQDNIRSVRIFLDMLREKGTRVSDYNDFYMQYTALQGKNDAHLKDFGKRFMEAINTNVLNIQKYTNYEYRDLENYVFLKHGIERNEYMRAQAAAEAVNKKLPPLTKEQIDGDIDGSLQDEYKLAYDGLLENELKSLEGKDYSGLFAVAAEIWAKQNGESFNPKKKGDVARIQKMDEFKADRDAVITNYIAQFEKTIAETIIPGHAKGEQLTIDGFWAAINAATHYSLDRLVTSGIESKSEVDDLKARYKYYVPMRGHEVEAEKIWQYEAPDNKNVVSKAIMQASGRGSRAEHPFAYIIQMAQTSINKANRNQLNQTILRLARMDKSGLMSVSEAWYVLTGTDPDTGKEIWTETEPDFSEDHEIRAGEIRAWNEKMKKLEEEGKARRFKKGLRIGGLFIKPKQKRQHAITIFEDGVAYQVYINGNPRVSQAINELNSRTLDNFTIVKGIRSLTRFISSMITSRSPQFMLTNGARDLAFASTILPSKEGARYTGQFLKNYPVAMAILANDATFDFGDAKAKYKKYLKEFEMNGGETGYSHLLELQDIQKELYKKQKGKNYLNPVTDMETIISVIDAGNKVIENSTRLAVYISSRENGRSIERSVSDSKEVTLNFNRRGSGIMGAAEVQSLFMFVNAGVQALANFGHVYKMHPAKMSATIGAYAAVGFIMPMIISMIGGDDDEKEYMNMSDWDRQTNLCLPTGGGFAKIPLPQEMRIFFKLGDEVYKLYTGRTEYSETAMATLKSAADMIPISPLGTIAAGEVNDFGDFIRVISPDAIRGVAELATNTNFMGGQIYDKYKADKEDIPGYQKARINRVGETRAPESIVGFTHWLDNLTGGDNVKKGAVSLNPDVVNHLAKSYLGGMYSLIAEGEKSFTKRFYTSNADIEEKNTTVKDYYKRTGEADEIIRQEKGYYEQWQSGTISETDYNAAVDQKEVDKAYDIHAYAKTVTRLERILKTGELTPDEELWYKNQSDSLKKEVIRIKLK